MHSAVDDNHTAKKSVLFSLNRHTNVCARACAHTLMDDTMLRQQTSHNTMQRQHYHHIRARIIAQTFTNRESFYNEIFGMWTLKFGIIIHAQAIIDTITPM